MLSLAISAIAQRILKQFLNAAQFAVYLQNPKLHQICAILIHSTLHICNNPVDCMCNDRNPTHQTNQIYKNADLPVCRCPQIVKSFTVCMHQQDGHTHAQRLCTQGEEDDYQGRGEPISVWLWRAADLTESCLPVRNFKTAILLSKQSNLAFFMQTQVLCTCF